MDMVMNSGACSLCQLISYIHVYSVVFSLTSNNTDCGTEGAKCVVRNTGLISINV
jgi:hypothetical protein